MAYLSAVTRQALIGGSFSPDAWQKDPLVLLILAPYPT